MLAVVLDCAAWPVLLAGGGAAARRRLGVLRAAGVRDLRLHAPEDSALGEAFRLTAASHWPGEDEVAAVRLLFVAGAPAGIGARLAEVGRRHRVIVNVEDDVPNCDVHMPAMVRRGDLLLAISTGGRSPALAAYVREWLGKRFGPEWAERVAELGGLRERLRAQGRVAEVSAAVRARAAEWLA